MEEQIIYQKIEPKIKLIKNTRGYGWEITLPQDVNQSYDEWIKQIKKIDDLLIQETGTLTKLKEEK